MIPKLRVSVFDLGVCFMPVSLGILITLSLEQIAKAKTMRNATLLTHLNLLDSI